MTQGQPLSDACAQSRAQAERDRFAVNQAGSHVKSVMSGMCGLWLQAGNTEGNAQYQRHRSRKTGPGRVGEVGRSAFDTPEQLATSVQLLAAAYAEMDTFTVPYLEVTG